MYVWSILFGTDSLVCSKNYNNIWLHHLDPTPLYGLQAKLKSGASTDDNILLRGGATFREKVEILRKYTAALNDSCIPTIVLITDYYINKLGLSWAKT